MTISRRASGITPSATLAIDARAKALKAQGEHIIGFAAGEPDFTTPAYICRAAHEAIDLGMTRYTPASGTPDLKKAVCEKLLRDNALTYAPEQIIISNGAKHSLMNAFFALLDPGDEVLLPAPCWLSYPELIRMAGGVPVIIPTTQADDYLPTIAQFAAGLTPRTKAIVINSPSNPTGCVYPEALLREIAAFAVEKQLYVISDEIYEQLVYDGVQHVSIAALGDAIKAQTIVINGLSKTYAMTGWRVGYAAGALPVIKAMTALQSHGTSNPNAIAQHASAAALRGGFDEIATMRAAFDARRRLMVSRIEKIDALSCATPRGAFYVMLNVQKLLGRAYQGQPIPTATALCALLLDEAKVAAVPGDPFEAPGYIRLSYAVSEADIAAGLDAIEAFIAALD
ncbi:MAG: pyridoxal phosphate-dependent aminotransferase [Oscillospiraceae bacterium]|nr:pyridoxal phosphate-dependent aminotransferase [Oscillospiraceae bacterium]